MSGGNHFMVNKFIFRSEMAFKAFFGAVNHVSCVMHPQRQRFLVRPGSRRMRTQPAGSGAVAVFAGDAFGNFERAAALLQWRIQCVARQALRRFFCFRAQFQDSRHALANVHGQRLVSTAVLVLDDPGRIFVLQMRLPTTGFTLP